MSAAVALRHHETRFLDVCGVDIRIGDRVWLVSETMTGLERICAGTVIDFVDGRVRWVEDLANAHRRTVHFSLPSALKVVGRAKGGSR